ncbi:hypothetical protein DL93DRAFT_2173908, partial [Clavulina sp. PMI_390]
DDPEGEEEEDNDKEDVEAEEDKERGEEDNERGEELMDVDFWDEEEEGAPSPTAKTQKPILRTAKESRKHSHARVLTADSTEAEREEIVHAMLEQLVKPTYSELERPTNELLYDLTETNWHAPPNSEKQKEASSQPRRSALSSTSKQLPTARRWHAFTAPSMAISSDIETAGNIEMLEEKFNFPFKAHTNPQTKAWYSNEDQPQLVALLAALRLVEASKNDPSYAMYQPRMVTKEALLAASQDEMGQLLPNVVLVKDPVVPDRFKPRYVAHNELAL